MTHLSSTMSPTHRVRAIALALVLALTALGVGLGAAPAGAAESDESQSQEQDNEQGASTKADPQPDWEIWALDQGADLNRIHVYSSDLEEVTVIDLDGVLQTPHMIDFDSRYRYAFVAGTTGGGVAVIRTSDYEVVEVIPTGAGAHMAAVTPDDSVVWVANIGAQTFTEIVIDPDAEEFEVGRELDVTADPLWQAEFGMTSSPVCHEYTADSRFAYVTLGPAADAGGVIVVDIHSDEPSVVKAFDSDEVRANCGLARSQDGSKMYANWGDPGPVNNPPAQTGEWYVFDTSDHSLIKATDETRGIDAHGVRITPDGTELWQVNRATDNGIIVDTDSDEIIDELADAGEAPDILDFSPDGRFAYVSLRGPNPVTGAPHAATGSTPGFSVIDVAEREVVEIVEPGEGDPDSDFHGLGVRVIDKVTRLSGPDRIATAVAISQDGFADQAAEGAVLARADDYPDALAGTPLAKALGGPLLLTWPGALPDSVAAELQRVLAPGATVTILGGTAAISAEAEAQLADLGFEVDRVAGDTRFETAVEIAGAVGDSSSVLLTTGLNFPDALTAGAAAVVNDAVVLLTAGDDPHPTTQTFLADLSVEVWAVGGPAARAHPDATPVFGATRHETALGVAEQFFDGPRELGVARSDHFADALGGGAHAAARGGPVLLTPTAELHGGVQGYVCDIHESLLRSYAYGGSAVVAPDVLHTLLERLDGQGCDD